MRPFSARLGLAILLTAVTAFAASVRESTTAATASDSSCAVSAPSGTFRAEQPQIFFRFVARSIRPSDQVRVDWVNPEGQVELSTPWTGLPSAQSLCFLTQMPLAGFPASGKPGKWTIEVVVNDRLVHQHGFRLEGEPGTGSVRIGSVTLNKAGKETTEFVLSGTGFQGDSVAHVAQFTAQGEWQYLFASLSSTPGASELRFTHANLPPGEYMAMIRNPDGSLSPPTRFVISTGTGTGREYRMPVPPGAPWVITQGPHGSFSHWNNSKHAWDIAPRGDRHVVAMRAGTVYTHDLGMRQTQHLRSFGNYITIDHGDGEFSHYAHLATGSFLVTNGQHVEQGQPLARAGNSGYTFGQGGGYHLHVHVTHSARIGAPSVPFEFEDLDSMRRMARSGR